MREKASESERASKRERERDREREKNAVSVAWASHRDTHLPQREQCLARNGVRHMQGSVYFTRTNDADQHMGMVKARKGPGHWSRYPDFFRKGSTFLWHIACMTNSHLSIHTHTNIYIYI